MWHGVKARMQCSTAARTLILGRSGERRACYHSAAKPLDSISPKQSGLCSRDDFTVVIPLLFRYIRRPLPPIPVDPHLQQNGGPCPPPYTTTGGHHMNVNRAFSPDTGMYTTTSRHHSAVSGCGVQQPCWPSKHWIQGVHPTQPTRQASKNTS